MSAKTHRDLTQGAIYSHMWKMALPMFLGMMAHMLLNIVDGIYVSRLGTSESLAILNYGFPLFYIPFALYNGLSSGTAAILAQLVGAKKNLEAQNSLAQSIIISFGMYIVLTISYFIFVPFYAKALNIDAHVFSLTHQYVSIVLIGMFFTSISLVLSGALRAEGNMRTGMNGMVIGTLLNLVLDPIFIFDSLPWGIPAFGWGIAGAAWATNIASFSIFLYITLHYLKKKSVLVWPILPTWGDTSHLKSIFSVSVPSMLSQSMMGLNTMAITFLATPFGPSAVAALGIGLRLDIIAIFPALSIMTAVVSLVGQNYGAKNYARVQESIHKGLLAAFVFVGSIGLLSFVFRGPMVGLFKPEAMTKISAMSYLGHNTFAYAWIGLAMVSAGAFQGLGKGIPNLMITAARVFILNLTLGYVLSRHTSLGEKGLHYAPMITNMIVGTVASLWVIGYLKKKIKG